MKVRNTRRDRSSEVDVDLVPFRQNPFESSSAIIDISAYIPWKLLRMQLRSILFRHFEFGIIEGSEDLCPKAHYHDDRADRCARIHVPCPLLRRPDGENRDRVESGLPQEEWRGPRKIREELIVQAARVKQSDRQRFQDRRDDKGTCDWDTKSLPMGNIAYKLERGFTRWLDPAEGDENSKACSMRCQ